jgi:hypothetical protein
MSRDIDANGYYWTRWVDPGTLLITIIVCAALAHSIYLVTKIRETRNLSVVVSVLLTTIFVFVSTQLYASFQERRQRLSTDAKVIYELNERIGEWVANSTPVSSVIGANDAGAIKYLGNRQTIDVLGLNNHERLFKVKTMGELVDGMQWLAVFPVLLENSPFRDQFEAIEIFQVAPQEYTLCQCPEQRRMVVYRKVGKVPGGRK